MSFLNARGIAIKILASWLVSSPRKRDPIEQTISQEFSYHNLKEKDKSLIRECVGGCIRHLLFLEWIVKRFVKGYGRLWPLIRASLLIGAYQILFLDRIPSYAAINETINGFKGILREEGAGYKKISKRAFTFTRLLNAALRNIHRSQIEGGQPEPPLHIKYSHPKWIIRRLKKRLNNKSALINALKANNELPSLCVRVNVLRITRDRLLHLFQEHGINAVKGRFSPDALIISGSYGNIKSMPGFAEGLFSVQDEASQLVGALVKPDKGERILDACAGVGGKTGHLIELSQGEAEIFAYDKAKRRYKILRENLIRLGHDNMVKIIEDDWLIDHDNKNALIFDKILIDAPCSGFGVIRRHPDIKWNRKYADIMSLKDIQKRLVIRFSRLIAPRGRLIYSTCTHELEETIEIIKGFLTQHPSWHVERALFTYPPFMDGFFIAVLKNAGDK